MVLEGRVVNMQDSALGPTYVVEIFKNANTLSSWDHRVVPLDDLFTIYPSQSQ